VCFQFDDFALRQCNGCVLDLSYRVRLAHQAENFFSRGFGADPGAVADIAGAAS